MRWCYRHTMYQFEIVIAQCRTGLGEEKYIAETKTSDGKLLFALFVLSGQQVAGGFAVTFGYFFVFFCINHFVSPFFILRFGQPDRMCCRQKLFLGSCRIWPHNGSVPVNLFAELFDSGREIADIISFGAQLFQEVIERGDYFHATGKQCVFARCLEIADSNSFIAVGLRTQIQILAQVTDKVVNPFHFGFVKIITAFVKVLCSNQ